MSSLDVECVVFPAYETKGELTEAVVRFAEWLTTLTVEKEVACGGAGKVHIVLCGHSMGGLLAVDTLLDFIRSRPDESAPLWPKIIACIAFDTPYFGLNPYVFKNTATKAAEYASTARTIATGMFGSLAGLGVAKKAATSVPPQATPLTPITAPPDAKPSGSVWKKWAPAAYAVGGALMASAAAGGAYYNREQLNEGLSWALDHMKYVKNLWDEKALATRVDSLLDAEEEHRIIFQTFYTLIPPAPPTHFSSRTFIVIPPKSARSYSHFVQAKNGLAPDELRAHTGMFSASTNDGYYELGLETAGVIRKAIIHSKGIIEHPKKIGETTQNHSHSEESVGNHRIHA